MVGESAAGMLSSGGRQTKAHQTVNLALLSDKKYLNIYHYVMQKKPSSHGKKQSSQDDAVVNDLEEQLAKLTDVAARAQADLQNFKDRQNREGDELRKFAAVPIVMSLLPVRDDLALAAGHEGEAQDGFGQILAKLDKVLSDFGVTMIKSLGEKVNPELHEIVNTGEGEKDVIVGVHQEGFEMQGKVLRPAKVQVGVGS